MDERFGTELKIILLILIIIAAVAFGFAQDERSATIHEEDIVEHQKVFTGRFNAISCEGSEPVGVQFVIGDGGKNKYGVQQQPVLLLEQIYIPGQPFLDLTSEPVRWKTLDFETVFLGDDDDKGTDWLDATNDKLMLEITPGKKAGRLFGLAHTLGGEGINHMYFGADQGSLMIFYNINNKVCTDAGFGRLFLGFPTEDDQIEQPEI